MSLRVSVYRSLDRLRATAVASYPGRGGLEQRVLADVTLEGIPQLSHRDACILGLEALARALRARGHGTE